ncbi:MAG: hypothetical protein JWN12_569 [Candidatus Saccharibacteria bacterium]|nr:hypothetical protein [Candidatus Saccharibacteria bacterium]
MLSAATAVLTADALHLGISENRQTEEDATHQECESTVQIGQLKISTRIMFDLKQRISKRTINNIVLLDALPVIWQAAGLYFGDRLGTGTPQTPLTSSERSRVIQHLEAVFQIDSDSPDRRQVREQERQGFAYADSRD